MHQAHLISSFMKAEIVAFTFHADHCLSKHQSSLFCFLETSEHVRRYHVQSFLPLNTLVLLLFAVQLVIALAAIFLLHFNLQKRNSHFGFSFMSTVDLFYCLFRGFQTLNTHTVPCSFVERVQKRYCYLSVSTLKSKAVHERYLVCCSLLSKYVVSTVFWEINLNMHQP